VRLLSLDVLRGLAVVGMILVDNQGSLPISDTAHIAWPVMESEWLGVRCTHRWTCVLPPSDCVFPCFLFVMGASCALALRGGSGSGSGSAARSGGGRGGRGGSGHGGRGEAVAAAPLLRNSISTSLNNNIDSNIDSDGTHARRKRRQQLLRIMRRTSLLFLFGVLLAFLAADGRPRLTQLCGVLHRLALCYCAAALTAALGVPRAARVGLMVGLVAMYCVFMYALHPPGCRRPGQPLDIYVDVTATCNAEARLDASIFKTKHGRTISEGAISLLTSTASTLAGLEFGIIWQDLGGRSVVRVVWAVLSACLLAAAWILATIVPLCKKLWSPPFAMYTTAAAGFSLAACHLLLDTPSPPLSPESGDNVRDAREGELPLLSPEEARGARPVFGDEDRHAFLELGGSSSTGGRRDSLRGGGGRDIGTVSPEPQPQPQQRRQPSGARVPLILSPVVSLGRNPLAVFLGMVLVETILLDNWRVAPHHFRPGQLPAGVRGSAWLWVYFHGFVPWTGDLRVASMVVALVHLAAWGAIAHVMDKRRIYVKL
jgi:predicted acyltransferase